MNLTELTPDEKICLVGLVVQMIREDGQISPEEQAEFDELSAEMGPAAFEEALTASRARFTGRDAVLAHAATVFRAEARQIIHTVLVDMASTDGISESEETLLRAVGQLWNMTRPEAR